MAGTEKTVSKQKQVSISEFFEKNKHFLGFDTLQRSIITAVKEAVDNSLDACEERRILPEIRIGINRKKGDRLELIVQDNGPGIPRTAIEHVFGRFLLGSRFHSIRQTRGQQGIGITGVVMYSQLTTGSKTKVTSKIKRDTGAVYVELGIDTRKNKAIKSREDRRPWIDEKTQEEIQHGLRIHTLMKAKYQRGKKSVYQYLRMTSIVNPHATISLEVRDRDGEIIEEGYWPRNTNELPRVVEEIDPHPHGIHLGTLQRMLRETEKKNMVDFLHGSFSGVAESRAEKLLVESGLENTRQPRRIKSQDAERLLECMQRAKFPNPKLNCLSPIEGVLIKKGMSKAIDSRFASTRTSEPKVSQGNPYQVEVGLIFGGDLKADTPIEILRFANRVPLMYQQGGCALTKAIESVNWRTYGLDQPGGRGIPKGPAAVLVHIASTNVQFTSEAKEAVAVNNDVMKEIRKSLQKIGQGLQGHLRKSVEREKTREKFDLVNIILPEIARKSSKILGREVPELSPVITKIMNAVFCEEEVGWDSDRRLATCTIKVYNYTARARAFRILAKWPEREGARIEDNELVGRKEAVGLWNWRIETLNPGTTSTIHFTVSGLERGQWTETEIFFRGNGEIIGATKIDEDILKEIRNSEEEVVIEVELEKPTDSIDWIKGRASGADVPEESDEIEFRQHRLDEEWSE